MGMGPETNFSEERLGAGRLGVQKAGIKGDETL